MSELVKPVFPGLRKSLAAQRRIAVLPKPAALTETSTDVNQVSLVDALSNVSLTSLADNFSSQSELLYLPLEVYFLQRPTLLQSLLSKKLLLSQTDEYRRCSQACWRRRLSVKKVTHPLVGVLPSFPIDVLDQLYSSLLSTPVDKSK